MGIQRGWGYLGMNVEQCTINLIRSSRFLVVDDQLPWVLLVRAVLFSWGATSIVGAESVAQAEETLQRSHIDIVLCDLHMPAEDGLALLRWVRAHPLPRVRDTAFALLTSDTARLTISRAACCGVDLVIEKPLRPDVLWPRMLALLNKQLSKSRPSPPCGKALTAPCALMASRGGGALSQPKSTAAA